MGSSWINQVYASLESCSVYEALAVPLYQPTPCFSAKPMMVATPTRMSALPGRIRVSGTMSVRRGRFSDRDQKTRIRSGSESSCHLTHSISVPANAEPLGCRA